MLFRTAAALLLLCAVTQGQDRVIASLEEELTTTSEPGLVMFELARLHAAAGRREPALHWIERCIALDLGFDPSGWREFDALRGLPRFAAMLDRAVQATPPVHRSRPAFSVSYPNLVVEGLAYDPVGRRFYLGSMSAGRILEVRPNGASRVFAEGLDQVTGVRVHAPSLTLWACSFNSKRGAVSHYDLRTRRLIKRYELAGDHLFNDLVVNQRGDVFLTDSLASRVYWIGRENDALAEFASRLWRANGLALSPDGARLFVAHFPDGLSILDVATRRAQPIARAPGLTLATIDGLYFYRRSLVAIQNGAVRYRAVRFHLNAALDRVERAEVLERRNPMMDTPTTGAIAGDWFYFIANSQLHNFENGKVLAPEKLEPVRILRVRLKD